MVNLGGTAIGTGRPAPLPSASSSTCARLPPRPGPRREHGRCRPRAARCLRRGQRHPEGLRQQPAQAPSGRMPASATSASGAPGGLLDHAGQVVTRSSPRRSARRRCRSWPAAGHLHGVQPGQPGAASCRSSPTRSWAAWTSLRGACEHPHPLLRRASNRTSKQPAGKEPAPRPQSRRWSSASATTGGNKPRQRGGQARAGGGDGRRRRIVYELTSPEAVTRLGLRRRPRGLRCRRG